MPRTYRRAGPLVGLVLVLAGCLPQVAGEAFATPRAVEAERTAEVAFHRMEIGRLETGSYTTNVLVDLRLPRGVRWTLIDFGSDAYRLLFTIDADPSIGWRVTPDGVRRIVQPPGPPP